VTTNVCDMKGNREELRRWNCRTENTSTEFAKLPELETACQSQSPLCFKRKMDEWKRNEKKELRPYTCGLERRDSRTLAAKKVEST